MPKMSDYPDRGTLLDDDIFTVAADDTYKITYGDMKAQIIEGVDAGEGVGTGLPSGGVAGQFPRSVGGSDVEYVYITGPDIEDALDDLGVITGTGVDGGSPDDSTLTIQVRRGTASVWSSENPVLEEGEIGFDTTNRVEKRGDGSTAWNALTGFNVDSGGITLDGADVAASLDTLSDAAKQAHQIAMLPGLGADDILKINGDGDAIEALDPAGLTLTPETLIYFDDESAPQSLTILELIELFADETGMTTVVGDGALTLTYKPHITDRCGYKVEMISSVTFNEVTDLSPGAVFLVYFEQDGTGSLTLSTGSGVTFATGWDGSLNDGADEVTAVLVRGGPGGETILELGETLA